MGSIQKRIQPAEKGAALDEEGNVPGGRDTLDQKDASARENALAGEDSPDKEDAGPAARDYSEQALSAEWEPPIDVEVLRILVKWQGYAVPVLPLEYEYGAYLRLGRFERARLLREFLREKAESDLIPISCSTAPLARVGGGVWSDPGAMIEGVSRLGWPFLELRLWSEWGPALDEVAFQVSRHADVLSVHVPPATEELLPLPDGQPAHYVLKKCAQIASSVGGVVSCDRDPGGSPV